MFYQMTEDKACLPLRQSDNFLSRWVKTRCGLAPAFVQLENRYGQHDERITNQTRLSQNNALLILAVMYFSSQRSHPSSEDF